MGRTWTPSQEAAMNINGKTLLVSAAAGSGKTSVLTERIIRSLTDPEHPADLSRMLVVTFTRAAAAELKGRIASALTDAIAQTPDNKHLSRQLFLLGSAQISTIDSFFQKAVRANFEQLSLPASFRPADEHEILPISLEILDGLIEEYYRAYTQNDGTDSPFERLRDNRFAHTIDHLISDRSDGKLNSVLLEFLKSFSSDPRGIKILQECAERLRKEMDQDYLNTSYGSVIHSHLSDLFSGYEAFLRSTLAHLEAAPDLMEKCGGTVESDAKFCRAMLEALDERSYLRVREVAFTFITGKSPTVKNKTSKSIPYQEWRTKFKAGVKRVQELLEPSDLRIREEMLETAELCEILYHFYTNFESRLMAEKSERGILEYNDVRAMLYKLLISSDGTPTPFAQNLASQYDAVYIDEYQDVDLLQDRIFATIGKDHRFMVGDIKQSIYGFRGSDPTIFAGYRREMPLYTEAGADAAAGNCVFMSENFRCDRPVIRFANKICAFLFSACEESIGYREQDDLVCSKPSPKNLPEGHPVPVKVEIFDAPPRKSSSGEDESNKVRPREESVWVAAEVARLLREEKLDNGKEIRPEDIAILVRNRTHGETYVRELKKLNVPVAASAASDLLHDPILTDLLNLLRAIDNPYRDLPLSEYLLSPFGGFVPEELNAIRDTLDGSCALYDALLEKAKGDDGLAQKCRTLELWMQAQRENAAVQPADRFLRLLYLEEPLSEYANHPAALFLYEQARSYQKSAFCGLYTFLSHLDKLMVGGKLSADGFSKAESAVTVMTAHHSKGLEFPVVFLCNLGSPFNREDAKHPLVYHRTVGCATRLYNRETGESKDTALRAAVKLRINEDQTEESIRTLYVALTRARERMYVTGTLNGKWDNTRVSTSLIKRAQRASILNAFNPLQWVLAALQENKADFNTEDWHLTHHMFGTVGAGVPLVLLPTLSNQSEASAVQTPTAVHYAEILSKRASFVYPQEHLRILPSKIAASKIRSNLLETLDSEEDDSGALDAQIELMRNTTPSFDVLLNTERKPSAAEIGTATHIFMELCNYAALRKNGVNAECKRLVAEGFLTQESVKLLNLSHLEKFRTSDLMDLIEQAENVRREQKFSLLFPASKLTSDPSLAQRVIGETVFVQGSIDLLLQMRDGRTVLIDYKTDRIRPEELENVDALTARMMAAHGEQLAAYARAITLMFGTAPSDIRIYSLPLGRTISLPTSELLKKADLY